MANHMHYEPWGLVRTDLGPTTFPIVIALPISCSPYLKYSLPIDFYSMEEKQTM